MAKFKTYYESLGADRYYTNVGSRIKPDYDLQVDDEGHEELVKVGEVDWYGDIQSHALSCDLNFILKRFRVTGDPTVLNVREGFYADVTDMPKSYPEMLQRMRQAESLFMKLKPEVRAEFNHSPYEFFCSIGTEKFKDVISRFEEPVEGVKQILNEGVEVSE